MWRNHIDESFVYSRTVSVPAEVSAELNEELADNLAEHGLLDDGAPFVAMFIGSE